MSPRLKLCVVCGRLTDQARCPDHRSRRNPTPRDPFYVSAAWQRITKKAKARDGHRCMCCGQAGTMRDPLTVHHHHPRATHPELELELDNLVTLRRSCHARIESARRARAKG